MDNENESRTVENNSSEVENNTVTDKLVNGLLGLFGNPKYPDLAKKLLVFPYPIAAVIVYVVLGKITRHWGYPLYLIFLTIPAYYSFAVACKAKTQKGFFLLLPIPMIAVIIFLILGSSFRLWHPGWIVFLLIPMYYVWVIFYSKLKGREK